MGGGVIVSASLEVVCLSIGFFKISTFRNLATCFMSFYIGIGISRYYDKIKCSMKNLWLVLLFDLLFLIKVPTAISSPYIMQCMGIAIILFLIAIEDFLEKQYYIKRQIITISKLSYPIFLLQHIIINVILSHTQERGAHILALIYACIIVCAWILFTLTNKLEKLIKEKNSTDC